MGMNTIILSTRNPSKAEQIKAIFAGSAFRVLTLSEAGIDGEGAEDSDNIRENAVSKARFAHTQAKGAWAMADDTGLFITYLGGAPGAKAARWAGDVPTDAIMRYTLRRMMGAHDRTATFRTAVALISPNGEEHIFEGSVAGRLLNEPRTIPQPKMPYSAIFVPNGSDKCWAEMTVEEENMISHRGKAFANTLAFLESISNLKPA